MKGPTTIIREPIPFHRPYVAGREESALGAFFRDGSLASPGRLHESCSEALRKIQGARHVMLTPSGTLALEMAALVLDIRVGDEVILPSFTFPSAAAAFALRGARLRFVDLLPGTMNIDPAAVRRAITARSRAVVVMHYGGVACDMKTIGLMAREHGLYLVEDAAHGIGAAYRGEGLGTMGDLGILSFHRTKNIHCGEGGALLLNRPGLLARARLIWEKGADQHRFRRGEAPAHQWMTLGSNYLMSALHAAWLSAQLGSTEEVNEARRYRWWYYYRHLRSLALAQQLHLPRVPPARSPNGHLFFIRCRHRRERERLAGYLWARHRVGTAFHYQPLHLSPAGRRYGQFCGEDRHTSRESERLLRLPLYPELSLRQQDQVIAGIQEFFNHKNSKHEHQSI